MTRLKMSKKDVIAANGLKLNSHRLLHSRDFDKKSDSAQFTKYKNTIRDVRFRNGSPQSDVW